jgi:hypothetical protein
MDTTKIKDLALTTVQINATAAHASIDAFKKFVGTEYATYLHGLTTMVDEVTKNARKIIEDGSTFAHAANKK